MAKAEPFDFDLDDDWGTLDDVSVPSEPLVELENRNNIMESSTTQYVFEIPEESPSINSSFTPTTTSTSSGSYTSSSSTSISTLALAHGLKLFSGAMLVFSIGSVALKQYGMTLGVIAYALGLFSFWKIHKMGAFAFLVASFLDIGAAFAFAYMEEFYNSTPLLLVNFLVVIVKLFGLYNAYIFWTQLQDGSSPSLDAVLE
eukprot:TRINITY_DN13793_c0_g1_i1.p1 TRINITY_DN13793_c0_g1~~TRINITY_DN13793_c0_g1_i1.p1  ORF type:complete len:201 (+),score=39.78 TRINITY_DN13793_c0_g1_i1:27-629(+)